MGGHTLAVWPVSSGLIEYSMRQGFGKRVVGAMEWVECPLCTRSWDSATPQTLPIGLGGRRLLLKYDPELLPDGEAQWLRPLTALSKSYGKDPAGASFHHRALLQAGLITENDETTTESESETESVDDSTENGFSTAPTDEPPSGTRWKKAKKPKNVVKSTDVDYYKLLGLEQERWMATEDQIVKAYRKVCLKMHPDKVVTQTEKEKEKAEEKFKEIQQAYEVLSNETSRRLYDSTDTFDESLPADCDPADFFKVYQPAFKRYARWSVDKTVPDLGPEEALWEDVSKFYDFWYAFKSWREFPHPDEEDPAQAECREHKRWIERQNMKLREKAKKDEGKRIREFVESAFRLDPRVTQHKEAQKQARLLKKKEKSRAREEAEEAERKLAEQEAAALKEQEDEQRRQQELEKKERELEKRALKEQRKRLRDLCMDEDISLLNGEDLDFICGKLDRQKIEKLSGFLENEKHKNQSKCKAVLKHTVDTLRHQEEEEKKQKLQEQEEARKAFEAARKDAKKKPEMMQEWSEDELRMLDKALNKFPQGTRKRWDQVTNYIRTRTLDEVLLMVKERQGASSKRFEAQQNWRAPQKEREIASEPTQADDAFTDVQLECKTDMSGEAVVTSALSGAWTKDQEVALVKALKAIGKEAADRWGQIAQQVPGKTKAECFKRFKELRETFRSNKDASQ